MKKMLKKVAQTNFSHSSFFAYFYVKFYPFLKYISLGHFWQYGGDVTRRMKLLKRQAEGKKRMRRIGNVEVPKDAFINVLKRSWRQLLQLSLLFFWIEESMLILFDFL